MGTKLVNSDRGGMTEILGPRVLGQLPAWLVLVIAATTLVLDSGLIVGLVVPGTTMLFALGFLAQARIVPLSVAIPVAAVATLCGSHLGYLRGRTGRGLPPKLVARVPAPTLARANSVLVRRGVWAVLGGHWLVSFRMITPRLAGQAGQPYRRFALANIVTGTAWAGTLIGVGYAFGVGVTEKLSTTLTVLAVLAVAALVAVLVVRKVQRDRRVRRDLPPPPAAPSRTDQPGTGSAARRPQTPDARVLLAS